VKSEKNIISLFVILLINTICFAGTGASFLKIIPGAQPAGMAGAYTAISGSVNSMYYNPAGIADIKRTQIGAMHTEWISDIRYDYAAGVFNMNNSKFGISAAYLSMGSIEGRSSDREVTEDFSAYDLAVQFNFAKDISNIGLIGGGLKLIRQQIADESANGFAVDLGAQKDVISNLSLGLAVRNLGPKMTFISEGYDLPLTLSLGTGLRIGGVTLAFDTNYEVIDKEVKIAFGTEYLPFSFVSLRCGYLINAITAAYSSGDNNEFDQKNGFGGGVGFNIFDYSLDYAVVPYSDLGTTQRLSLTIGF